MKKLNLHSRKAPFVILALAAFIAAGFIIYQMYAGPRASQIQETMRPSGTSSSTEPATGTDAPATNTTPSGAGGGSNANDLPAKEEKPPAQSASLGLTLVRAGQISAGQEIEIRTDVFGTTSGNCEVTLTRDGQPAIKKTYSVSFEATSASCANANIPASEFSADGDWQLSIIVKKDNQSSNTATATVNVKR